MTPKNPPDDGCFKCIKITLIVLYILALITYVILLAVAVLAFVALQHIKPDELHRLDQGQGQRLTEEDISTLKAACLLAIVLSVIPFTTTILGLVGAIKEHGIIMLIMTVLNFLYICGDVYTKSWFSMFLSCIMLSMTGYFAYVIFKRNKMVESNHAVYSGQSVIING